MVDSTTAIPAIPATQFTQTVAQTNANNAAFLANIAQSVAANDLELLDSNQTTPQSSPANNEGLLNLDTPTLSLFNEVGNNPVNANITGDFTTQQLQEIGILQQDMQALEDAANSNNLLPLTDAATTVDLSAQAQAITTGISTIAAINNPSNSLTTAQIAQVAAILAPLANQPLNPSLFSEIQTQLTASGVNPSQFNLTTLTLVMNYIAAMQPASMAAIEENNVDKIETPDEETVAATEAIDRVAIENGTIL